MNKAQKAVEQAKLDAEKKVLKTLNYILAKLMRCWKIGIILMKYSGQSYNRKFTIENIKFC